MSRCLVVDSTDDSYLLRHHEGVGTRLALVAVCVFVGIECTTADEYLKTHIFADIGNRH